MDTQSFTVGPLPPGVAAPTTTAERAIYRKALDLEGVFTQHLVDAMMQSASSDDDKSAGAGIYKEMANQQVNSALINGGGLGLAGALYSQMKDAK
jgi:Rod binding domain-containing protein